MRWGPEDWDAWALRRHSACEARGSALPPQEAVLLEELRRVPGRERMTVADLGCGSGRLLPALAGAFGRVVAVDYAPASLALARRVLPGKHVAFRRRDLRDLAPFRNAFDVAVAVDSILGPRTEDVDRILEQIRSSLKEGGLLAATFPASPRDGRPRPLRLAGDRGSPEPVGFHEVELQYRLRRAGFGGMRLFRFAARGGGPDALLCLAARRSNN